MSVQRARILLVDDRPENLLALEALLEPLGQEIVRASSGEAALRAVLLHDFAAILLDVQMPGMNGFETASLLKSRARSRATPIIFLTAISKEERFVTEGYSVGAVDYMSKPLQPEILRSKVAVFVDLWLKNQQLREQAELLRESERRELELRHEAAIRETEARAAQIVGSATDAIITFDAARRITLFNRAAEAIFGLPAASAMGLELESLLHPRSRADLVACVASLASAPTQASPPEVLTGLRAAGADFPFELSLSRLDLAGGPVFALIGRDVTERVRTEEELRRQAAELEAAATELRSLNEDLQERQAELERAMSARSRFYASMSHELRTPINAILGYSELLLDEVYGTLNERQAQGIERTRRAGRHLLELVNDVLDLSKIEAGKLELQFEAVPFPGVLDDLFVTVKPMADQRGCALTLELHGPPCTMVTDPRRVRQILLNLVSNALKFGAGKPVEVHYQPTEDGIVELTVVDHGPGIPEEDRTRIFEEFVQLGSGPAEGTGLGLPISRRLAQLLGGNITIASTPGDGSRFTVALPSCAETMAREVDAAYGEATDGSATPEAIPGVVTEATDGSAAPGAIPVVVTEATDGSAASGAIPAVVTEATDGSAASGAMPVVVEAAAPPEPVSPVLEPVRPGMLPAEETPDPESMAAPARPRIKEVARGSPATPGD